MKRTQFSDQQITSVVQRANESVAVAEVSRKQRISQLFSSPRNSHHELSECDIDRCDRPYLCYLKPGRSSPGRTRTCDPAVISCHRKAAGLLVNDDLERTEGLRG